jgi:hypothetical protein
MNNITHRCEGCGRRADPLSYDRRFDEYRCDLCLDQPAPAPTRNLRVLDPAFDDDD